MPPVTPRLFVASLALLALAPTGAAASPYRILAPATAPEPPPVLPASPSGTTAPTDSAAIAAATSPTQPLSSDPALEYRRGEQAYALGNYEQAVRHFEHSYQLSNFADLLYNIGLAHAQWHGLDGDIGHLRKARRLFQNYIKRLAENPAMDQSQRAEAEAQVARIDEQISEYEAKQAVVPPPVVEPDPDPKPAPPPVDRPERKPVHKRGWFWGVIGGIVVIGAVTAAVVLTRKPGFEPELGTIGPNTGAVGLRF
jgi:tetratricopeptide (TPR) repeat protein